MTLVFFLSQPSAFAKQASEYELKAAFLLHFMDFTQWPHDNNRIVCVYGNNPFKKYLQTLNRSKPKHQQVLIKYTDDLNEANDCNILFITRSKKHQLEQILSTLENRPLLTVSDIEGFAANSGMVELATKSDKIRLVINLSAVKKPGIKLSSNLIELARLVVEQPKKKIDRWTRSQKDQSNTS